MTDVLTAADVRLMQGLAQRITATHPDLLNTAASFGQLGWYWGRAGAAEGATWRRRLWFAADELVAWAWGQGGYLAYQVHPDHASLVDDVIGWFDGPGEDRTVLPSAVDEYALARWAAHGYAPNPTESWTEVSERDLAEIEEPVLAQGFQFRTADEVAPIAVVQAHVDAWPGSTYTVGAYEDLRRTNGYRGDLHVLVQAPDGTMAGSAIMWLDEVNATAEFEPVGTHPGHRRHGLGRALLLHGMHAARAAGAARMTVACSGEPGFAAARGLYASVGFRPRYRDQPFVKRAVAIR